MKESTRAETATVEVGLHEVARILAAGILRAHVRRALAAESPSDAKKLPKSDENDLEVPDKFVLSVHTG